MKTCIKKTLIYAGTILLPWAYASSSCCDWGHTYWTQREQDAQQWLYMALSADKQHKSYDNDKWHNSAAIKVGYERTFDGKRISSYFFGKDGCLKIGPDNFGSGVQDKFDVRSSDLGLPAKLEGYATLNPRISNVYVDFDWYGEWNQWVKGLHTWVNIPFIRTKWSIGLCTKITKADPGIIAHPGYYVPYRINTNPPTAGVADTTNQYQFVVERVFYDPTPFAFTGDNAIADALLGDTGFGYVPTLTTGKIKCGSMAADGLAGIRFGMGYDFLRKERGNMGIGIDVVAPAANKPAKNLCCCNNSTTSTSPYSGSSCGPNCCDSNFYYFMPSIGGQNAWKVGGVLRGQYIVWNKANDHNITMYLDGRAYGVLKTRSTRLLGLHAGNKDKFNHWLTLKKYDVGNVPGSAYFFDTERAANLLKAYVENKTGVEGQVTIMFTYKKGGFTGELGYNFFGRRAECIKYWKLCNNDVNYYKYVIRAEAPVYPSTIRLANEGGFFDKTKANINTVPTATIDGNLAAVAASGSMSAPAAQIAAEAVNSVAFDFSNGHNSDVRTSMAQHPAYYAHTIFSSLGYTWVDNKRTPSLGVIGKVELGHSNTSLRSWGIFVEGGLTF